MATKEEFEAWQEAALKAEKDLFKEIDRLKAQVERLKVANNLLKTAKHEAENNLIEVGKLVNRWARESGYAENTDFLGLNSIRDHLGELIGFSKRKDGDLP